MFSLFSRLLAAGLLLALAPACQQKPAETMAPPASSSPDAPSMAAAPTTLAQRFSPILSGNWVSAAYLDEVARTRSPETAFNHVSVNPTSLTISSFALQKDSVELGVSYGLHEGGSLTLLLRPTKRTNALPLRHLYTDQPAPAAELSYRIAAGDTTLVITYNNGKPNQPSREAVYQRTGRRAQQTDLEMAVHQGVNHLLLARAYRGTDSLGQPVQARFSLDGLVTGLPFKKYFIQVDFMGPNPGNVIIFDVYTKRQQQLAASFGRDTLRLYTVHSYADEQVGDVFTRGRLRYQLIPVQQP